MPDRSQVASTDAGRLSALVFTPDESIAGPVPAGHVEIKVKAIGMNMFVSCVPLLSRIPRSFHPVCCSRITNKGATGAKNTRRS